MKCKLCPHECGAYRDLNTSGGRCGLTLNPKVARIAPHLWEEPPISGTLGSGAIFFSGCTLNCVFCQNYDISAKNKGIQITAETLSDEYKRLEEMGVHNINLVSATQYLPEVIKSFELYTPKIPVVYNCGGFERVETLKALEGIVDIYLPDFKYSYDTLALAYSGCKNYTEIATKAIGEMLRQKGNLKVNREGIATEGVMIRHLVLPNYTKNSIGVLDILKENFGDNITVSLMGQYIPHGKAKDYPKLSRKITKREYGKVLSHLWALGLDGFMQELESADKKYIPEWNYKLNT